MKSLDSFIKIQSGYYYSENEKLTYIKTPSGPAKKIILNGVNKASYKSKHASLNQDSANTDNNSYNGEGFVNQYTDKGDGNLVK